MAESTSSSRSADVIVIGGGIIGCSIALRLAQAKLRVSVFERGAPGAEASSAAAGMLAPQGEKIEPDVFSQLCVASRELFPSFVSEVEQLSGETLGYRDDGTLLVAINPEECHELEEVYEGQTRAGFKLERLSGDEVRRRVAGLSAEIRCGLFVPGDHWVDNERLAQAVAGACRRLGASFHTESAVTKLNVRNGRVESLEALTGSGKTETYSAGHFVLAAGCWSAQLVAPHGIALPMQPCRGQMIEFDSEKELPLVVRSGIHYLVPRSPNRVLVGTTAEYVGFEKSVTGEGLQFILNGASRIAPLVKSLRYRRAWAGLRPDTSDHLPLLGYGELENLVFATGHFRNGILLAPMTAQLVSELILTGTTSHPIDAYRPTRFSGKK